MKRYLIKGLLVITLISTILLVACATTPSDTTTTSGTSSSGPKELKIGILAWMGWPNGLDMVRGTELMAEMDNKNGGLSIGSDRYNVTIIKYDSNNDQSTAASAVNKLVFEDKVKFIITDGFFTSAVLPTTDKNNVILAGWAPDYDVALSPNYKYHFDACGFDGIQVALTGWFCKKYPEKANNIVFAFPDNQQGHANAKGNEEQLAVLGAKPTSVFYPASSQDLSALGTKVKTLNPAAFSAAGGGPVSDGLAIKAVFDAGYRGTFFANATQPAITLSQIITNEALEGFICGAFPVEFDPAQTEIAKEFKAAWIAKYEKWEGPEIISTGQYAGLRNALQKAGTLDVDKVSDVIFSGMEYEGPTGRGKMISRPDLGNSRTVDSILNIYVKQIKSGNPTVLDSISIEDGVVSFNKVYGASK